MYNIEREEKLSVIAEGSGVSISTVSRYFSGSSVRNSSKLKIESFLNKQNRLAAPSVEYNGNKVVGLILPYLSNYFYTQTYQGIIRAANEMGYMVMTGISEKSKEQERLLLRRMYELGVNGVIYVPICDQEGQIPEEIGLYDNIPLVVANRRNYLPNRTHIYVDNINAGYIATHHLINRHRDAIGFIFGTWNEEMFQVNQLYDIARNNQKSGVNSTSLDRFRGYLDALEEAGIAYNPNLVAVTAWNSESGSRGVSEIVHKAPYLNGLISSADYISASAINTLQRLGYSVPRDISVVGWCNSELASFVKPMLTSINVPLFDLGFTAMLALDRLIRGLKQDDVVYSSSLILRESTSTLN